MTTTSAAKLLDCPFCGKPPMVVPDDSYDSCFVGCVCALEPTVFAPKGELNVAIEQWNRRALPDDDGWQPIETAPKGAPEIILARGNRVTSGFWMNETEVMGAEFHSTGAYLGQYPTGEVHESGWMSQDGGFTDEQPPTHWRPLPKPPETRG
jgi:hypothetical protein